MGMLKIYEAVRAKLGNTYQNVFYQTMRENEEGDVGIYLYDSSNENKGIDGTIFYDSVKVQVQVNAYKSIDGMETALNYLDEFTRKMETEQSDIEGISFISCEHQGARALAIGKNEYGIQIVRCILDLKYILDEDDD